MEKLPLSPSTFQSKLGLNPYRQSTTSQISKVQYDEENFSCGLEGFIDSPRQNWLYKKTILKLKQNTVHQKLFFIELKIDYKLGKLSKL